MDKALEKTLEVIAVAVKQIWVEEANKILNTTRLLYLGKGDSNLRVMRVSPNKYSVVLGQSGDLANKIEGGSGPYDLKPLLLMNKEKNIIPFSFGEVVSGEVSKVGPSIEHRGGTVDGREITKQVMEALIKSGYRALTQKKLTDLADRGAVPPSALDIKSGNKGSIYTGIRRMKNIMAEAKRKRDNPGSSMATSVGTYRTVSSKSPGGSWMHPGFQARHLAANTVKKAVMRFGTEIKVNNRTFRLNITHHR